MSDNCNHDCENCSSKCDSPESEKQSFLAAPNPGSDIKKIIGVISGKGGVGKSLVTSLLAVNMRRRGYNVAVLDGDITGPSIPKLFGVKGEVIRDELGLYPLESRSGIKIMSTNLLLENETDPVIWRGPIIAGMVKQFYSEVVWEDVDYMFVDMPPGTGDVPLTVFQSIPLDGIVVVTSPQELVSMIVSKAVKMAGLMNVKVLGIVENMSYFVCPDCGGRHKIFGESSIEKVAGEFGIENVAKLPIDPRFAAACDDGMVELSMSDALDGLCDKLEELPDQTQDTDG
ncbi:MAG: Mrp/NBP35 family ATP-binding protein [Clostridia bacterium]|nr:Mrp/NBP35 family ATP-binding protein [Clostridia bacterium]